MSYTTYIKHKPSGIEWLGEIPEHWGKRRLKYCAPVVNEKTDGAGSGLPYTGLEHIESWTGKLIATTEKSEADGQANHFRSGDVLFGKLRPYLAKVFRPAEDGVCTGELLVLRPEHVARDYLFYYMLTQDFISIVDSSTYGAKMPRASWDFIGNFPVLLPPENEQRAIAAFLDRETGRIDALIKKKERQIELLQEKRAAVISHAVTKGLNPNVKMKDSGIQWLGKIPEHWEVKRLKLLGSIRYGLGEPPEYVEDGLPFVRATDINHGKIDLELVKKVRPKDIPWDRRPQLQTDEILVVRSGAYTGDSAIVTKDVAGCIAGYDMVLTVRTAHPAFVAWVLLSKYVLQGQIHLERLRAAQPHLNAEELGSLMVLVPPAGEQRAIAAFLDRETVRIDTLIGKIRKSIDLLREYRAALITAAVTGKIDVRREVV